MEQAEVGIGFLCDESISLFGGGGDGSRPGGAGINMYLLAKALQKNPRYQISFFFENEDVSSLDGEGVHLSKLQQAPIQKGFPIISRFINNYRKKIPPTLFDHMPEKRVLISTMAFFAPRLQEVGRAANAKTIYRIASDSDVTTPRGITTSSQQAEIREALTECDLVVAQTEQQHKGLQGFRKKESVVIRSGIAIPPNRISQFERSGVLWVASSQGLKQPWLCLMVAEALPHRKFTMIMPPAELGLAEYVKRRAAGIQNLDLIDRQVPFDEVQSYFNRAAVFLYTNELGGHDTTIAQATAGGCAIVSESLDPEDGMFSENRLALVSERDLSQLVKHVEFLLDNPDERELYSKAAYQYAQRNRNIQDTAEGYKRAIDHLLSL